MPVIKSRFGKVLGTVKTWRQAGLDSLIQAQKAQNKDDRLLDAQSGASLMSGGTLGAMSMGRAGRHKETNGGRPVKNWKSYPNRDGRTTRQWRVA